LKDKHLRDVFLKLQSHRKATPKTTEKLQSVENQAFCEILFSFSVHYTKVYLNPHPLGTIFARKKLVFSIYPVFTEKTEKQKNKNQSNH
jgi:hypothetical protein